MEKMIFKKLKIQGVYLIINKNIKDKRGYFSRIYCEKTFKKKKLNTKWVQFNKSYNKKKYTFRGLHYQKKPYEEVKLIKCIKGSIIDILLDIRKKSKTYGKFCYIKLSEKKNSMVYLPKGVAHGFLTLENNTEIFYLHSEFFTSNYSVCADSKKINYKIKKKIRVISKIDRINI